MKKLRFLALSTILILFLLSLSACVSQGDYEKLQGEFQISQTNIANLQATVKSIQADLDFTKNSLNETQKSLATTEMNRKSLQDELTISNGKVKTTQDQIKSTQDQLDVANGKIKLYQDTLGVTVNSNIQPPYTKTSTPIVPINIVNNQDSKDPTWKQLVSFILADKTDTKLYIPDIRMCGAFAEEVHNNAEAAGIRAAMVAIHFSDGSVAHALNAFKTTDKGLVYIDCTGKGLQNIMSGTNSSSSGWDKLAYLVKDKKYGLLALNVNDVTDYDFYLLEKAKWEAFENKLNAYYIDVENFNSETAGQVYYTGTSEWQRISKWKSLLASQYNFLKILEANLNYMWEPLGTISDIEIYW